MRNRRAAGRRLPRGAARRWAALRAVRDSRGGHEGAGAAPRPLPPSAAYNALVAAGALEADDAQRELLRGLDRLHGELLQRCGASAERGTAAAPSAPGGGGGRLWPPGWWRALFGGSDSRTDLVADAAEAGPSSRTAPSGLYVHGDVGCGKTLLLDLFYSSLPPPLRKRRTHVQAFVQEARRECHRLRAAGPRRPAEESSGGWQSRASAAAAAWRAASLLQAPDRPGDGALVDCHIAGSLSNSYTTARLAAARARHGKGHWGDAPDPYEDFCHQLQANYDVFCLDELQATDAGDAALLARVVAALLRGGVTVVATSNRSPEHFLELGGHYARFVQALQRSCDVHFLPRRRDFRRGEGAGASTGVYGWPDSAEQRAALLKLFQAACTEPLERCCVVSSRRAAAGWPSPLSRCCAATALRPRRLAGPWAPPTTRRSAESSIPYSSSVFPASAALTPPPCGG
eukprot:TRINITY_DN37374_c0_g1_i1.p1 TRINITY_DN37374_c0_g1~~TRINITY_DN37374_c0_g1_i1.p1  ORF type:complete len:486 (+),score=93.44 TRINITY_DN37374_c0_g1_i1:82-1458(+)